MHILVLSTPAMAEEFKAKFPEGTLAAQTPVFLTSYSEVAPRLKQAEVVFDFLLPDNREQLQLYLPHQGLVVFCHAVTLQLAELLLGQESLATFIGFNGLPTLFNRPVLEVSLLHQKHFNILESTCQKLGTEFLLVEDRIGMVTPRVLCMIINEAFYTLQERTASAKDIDLSMRLGTNYPKGPLEWARQIGLANVYQVLQELYNDTKDERYKICPLLKTLVLQGNTSV